MTLWEEVMLGDVQGLTEVLPVSSLGARLVVAMAMTSVLALPLAAVTANLAAMDVW